MRALFVAPAFEYLGIEHLSACLRSAGHQTKLIFDPLLFGDLYFRIDWLARRYSADKAIIRTAREYKPDVIMFSLLSDLVPWVKTRARQLKEATGATVIVGGIHATSIPERVARSPLFDYVVVGEGEDKIVSLLDRLENGKDVSDVKGVFFKRNEQVVGEREHSLIQDLDAYPMADKELWYDAAPWAQKEYNVILGRGCPLRCTFCHYNLEWKLWDGEGRFIRTRSIDHGIRELVEARKRYGFTTLNFWDENLFAMRTFATEFMEAYADHVGVPFWLFMHPSTVTDRIAKTLARAGCWEVEMGVQTNDEHGRRICDRPETDEIVIRAVNLLKDQGIRVTLDSISGLPEQNTEHLYATAKFFARVKPDRILAFMLRYYPATDMVKIGLDTGALTAEDVEMIEAGEFVGAATAGGHVRDREVQRLTALLLLSPKLPEFLIRALKWMRAERWFPDVSHITHVAARSQDFFRKNDLGARTYRKRHLYYVFGEGRQWLHGD